MNALRKVAPFVFALALAAAAGCTSDSPTEPSTTPSNPKPPVPVTTYSVTVTASPSQLTAGATTPSTITVQAVNSSTGQPPANSTNVVVTTTLGDFGSPGSGQKTITLQLVNGRATTALFPGADIGTATVRADLGGSVGVANVGIGQAATFFISSITPAVGNPQGGQDVVITGGGFSGPVRVTFNGAAANVKSVSPTQIRVTVPSASAAGVTVGVGEAKPVNVGVTIHYNETGQLSDTLPNGFTYALGGTVQPQVFSVTPASGTNDGGTQVTIIGDGFQSPVQVFFGLGTSAGSFDGVEATVVSVTPTRLVVVSPSARGFGQSLVNQLVNVLVKNLNTGFSTVSPQAFKYGNKVIITAMDHGSGLFSGGDRVTIFGQGFDDPVAVSLGGIGQFVVSTTGTEIVFLTAGITPSSCPANGIIPVTGVSVTNIETGDTGTANLGFNYVVPLPRIFGVSPSSGNIGATVTVSGENFAGNVQVIFGDPTTGSSAPIVSKTSKAIQVVVPTPASGFVFNTVACDGNGDGIPGGTKNLPTPISVTLRNLDVTGCVVTLTNGFVVNPSNASCNGDTSVPPTVLPQCSDGLDNDNDGLTDFGPNPSNDPGCTSSGDNSEVG